MYNELIKQRQRIQLQLAGGSTDLSAAARHTLDKILALDRLPTHKEVIDLLFYDRMIREAYESNFEISQEDFDFSENSSFLTGNHGIFANNGIYYIITHEFIRALAREISLLNAHRSIIETNAGAGKLSFWLNKYSVPIVSVDEEPKSPFVERMSYEEALRQYNPELIVVSNGSTGGNLHQSVEKVLGHPHIGAVLEISPHSVYCYFPNTIEGIVLEGPQRFLIPFNPYNLTCNIDRIYTQALPIFRANGIHFLASP